MVSSVRHCERAGLVVPGWGLDAGAFCLAFSIVYSGRKVVGGFEAR